MIARFEFEVADDFKPGDCQNCRLCVKGSCAGEVNPVVVGDYRDCPLTLEDNKEETQ